MDDTMLLSYDTTWRTLPTMTTGRICQDCGEDNLVDAEYCAACGVAIDTASLERPWLAALIEDADENTETGTSEPGVGVVPSAAPQQILRSDETASWQTDDPAPSSRPWLAPTIAVFVVLVLGAALITLLALDGNDSNTDPAATAATTVEPNTTPAESATTVPTEGASDATTPAPADDSASELAALAASDLDRAFELRGRWVPQLSAKRDGTEWEGVTYDLAAIVDLHEALSAQVGPTLLIEGSSLAFVLDGERMAGWWITVADSDFEDADGALGWCDDAGFDRANCAARLLTDDDTATGTLRLQAA